MWGLLGVATVVIPVGLIWLLDWRRRWVARLITRAANGERSAVDAGYPGFISQGEFVRISNAYYDRKPNRPRPASSATKGKPMKLIPLTDLISDLQTGDKNRAKHWLTEITRPKAQAKKANTAQAVRDIYIQQMRNGNRYSLAARDIRWNSALSTASPGTTVPYTYLPAPENLVP